MDQAAFDKTFRLPFAEASAFFRAKLNIPTRIWTDLWQGENAKGFMTAGTYEADLLADFNAAVQSAIDGELTLAQFQGQFDQIVAKHGWSYNGSRNWRSELIYNTNVRTSYMAGRWQQMTDVPKGETAYLLYRHADGVRHPRPQHQAWNGLILPADHPFWQTHYPPNGWGCHCTCFRVTAAEYRQTRREPPPGWNVIDPNTGAPPGIDMGWAYNVGTASQQSHLAMLGAKLESLPPAIAAKLRDAMTNGGIAL